MQELLETGSQAQENAVSSEGMETDVTETEKQSNDVEVQACISMVDATIQVKSKMKCVGKLAIMIIITHDKILLTATQVDLIQCSMLAIPITASTPVKQQPVTVMSFTSELSETDEHHDISMSTYYPSQESSSS